MAQLRPDDHHQLIAAKLEFYEVAAGWSAIIRLPQIFPQDTAFETLRRLAIVTYPAHFFGLEDANRVVLSLITPTEIMQEAIERISVLLRDSC